MGTLRFTALPTHPTEVLDLTSLTMDEFQRLVLPFEAAYQSHMAHWRLEGKPRTARWYTTCQNGSLPTPEDRLLFILVYLKTYPLQVVQGRLFGIGQSKAHQWLHVLLVVLRATLRALVVPTEEPPPASGSPAAAPASAPAAPLLGTTGPSGASSAPSIQLRSRAVIAARKSATRSKTSC